MKLQQIILLIVGVAAATALVALGVFSVMGREDGGSSGESAISNEGSDGDISRVEFATNNALPRIAIITNENLEYFYSDTERSRLARERRDREQAEQNEQADPDSDVEAQENTQKTIVALSRAIHDELETELADRLTQSRRFAIVEPLKVRQIIGKLAQEMQLPEEEVEEIVEDDITDEQQQREFDLVDFGRRFFSGDLKHLRRETRTNDDGSETVTTYISGGSSPSATDVFANAETADLQKAAEELGAEYVLVVAIQEPRVTVSQVRAPYSESVMRYISVEPVFTYRMFQSGANTVIISKVTRPDRAIRIPIDMTKRGYTLAQAVAEDEANFQLFRSISSVITRDLVDTIAPAQISSTGPYTIDRGRNDGVEANAEFDVSRVANVEAVGANGIVIRESVREPLGRVRVTRVQQNLAYVEPIFGDPFQVGDVIETYGVLDNYASRDSVAAPRPNTPQPASTSPTQALGARAIATQRAQQDGLASAPRIAISQLSNGYTNCDRCGAYTSGAQLLEEAIIDDFRNDPRVRILSRQDFRAMEDERRMSDINTGDFRTANEGAFVANYILTGSVSYTVGSATTTTSMGGETRTTGGTSRITAEGNFRILNPETSEIMETTSVQFTKQYSNTSGATTEIAYRAAADGISERTVKSLMNKLFPPVVLGMTQDGSRVRIGAGEAAGFSAGRRVAVYTTGEAQRDYYTQQLLSRTRQLAGHLSIVDATRDASTAVFEGTAFTVKLGDEVEVVGAARKAATAQTAASTASTASPPAKPDADEDPDVPF